ncbi:MAG TPA: NAD(P)H-quinone oxidoreductase [Burkholderiales bacterium]|jgi:NADPH2:quinone reductase
MSTITSTRAVEVSRAGGPEVLQLATRPIAPLKEHEILVKVEAAGVNGHDVMHRKNGTHPTKPGETDVPGLEVAGAVVAVGSAVKQWKVGDKVCSLVQGGGYADYCLCEEALTLPVPKGLSMVEAASLPETYATVWSNLYADGSLKAGGSVLVQGGASGIGVSAIQLLKNLGHRVFVTAGSDEKCKFCVDLGAERAINYKKEDFVAAVKSYTDGKGVDCVVDIVAGSYIPREIEAIATEGWIVIVSTSGGAKVEVNFSDLMRKRGRIMGNQLRPRPLAYKAAVIAALKETVWPLVEAGKIKPVVDSTFPLAEAVKSHERMDASLHTGKIILTM